MPSRRPPLAVLLLLLVCCLPLTGCWDRRELDEQVHVLSAFVDLEEDGLLRLTLEVLGLIGVGGEASATHSVLSARGPSFQAAAWSIRWQAEAQLSFSHMEVVVIGEALARAGIQDVLDAMIQSYQIRRATFVAVTPGRASDILSTAMTSSRHSEQLTGLLSGAGRAGADGGTSTLNEALKRLATEGVDMVLARLILIPPPPITHAIEHVQGGGGTGGMGGGQDGSSRLEPQGPPLMAVSGAALFKGDRLAGFLEEWEAEGIQFVLRAARARRLFVPTGLDREGFTLRIAAASPLTTGEVEKGRLRFNTRVFLDADVEEYSGGGDIATPADITHLEAVAEGHVEAMALSGLWYSIQEMGVDAIGHGRYLSRYKPDLWQTYHGGWPEALKSAEITVEAEVNIVTTSMLIHKVRGPALAPDDGGN